MFNLKVLIMKKQCVLFFVLATMSTLCLSCSSNDDGDNNQQLSLEQLFTGEWQPLRFVVACSGGTNEIESYTTCEQMGRLTISASGSWSETYFYEEIDNSCVEDGVDSGTWRITDGKLFVVDSGFGEVEITFFEVSENSLRVGQNDDDFPCDGGNGSTHYYNEYIKI